MKTVEETLISWRKEEFSNAMEMMEKALEIVSDKADVVKQKDCATFFNVSVNTVKKWVKQGAPEIRLDSGMPMYSKKAVTEWLISNQK